MHTTIAVPVMGGVSGVISDIAVGLPLAITAAAGGFLLPGTRTIRRGLFLPPCPCPGVGRGRRLDHVEAEGLGSLLEAIDELAGLAARLLRLMQTSTCLAAIGGRIRRGVRIIVLFVVAAGVTDVESMDVGV